GRGGSILIDVTGGGDEYTRREALGGVSDGGVGTVYLKQMDELARLLALNNNGSRVNRLPTPVANFRID
ncbi:MAG: hypothetical protein AAF492_29040, partial [Verrucomicrobiota bacterium]